MRKIFILITIVLCFFELTGCATNASADKMVYKPQTIIQPKNQRLSHAITVDQVSGGRETNALGMSKVNNAGFKAALEESLRQSNLYSNSSNGKYVLNATLKRLGQPWAGFDIEVSCTAHYSLADSKTNKLIYDKDIISYYTAHFADSISAVTRLKLANEGAVKTNIEMLINDLEKLPA